jgi:aspartyl-tRNA(Asn)/glutamyl-tRNA(Gln) amidotransferase subunit B
VQKISRFDRKSYFYPDLPMGYQITQQHTPTNIDGEIIFFTDKEFTQTCSIRIDNAHIETDTGKTSQE